MSKCKTNAKATADLFRAVKDGAGPDVLAACIQRGANVNAKEPGVDPRKRLTGMRPLHYAEREDAVQLLLANGAEPNARSGSGSTPLHHAKSGAVARLLIAGGTDLAARDQEGNSPLHEVSRGEVAAVLLEAGTHPMVTNDGQETPLHRAYDIEIARLLIDAGADIHARDCQGQTPLHTAMRDTVARELVLLGADVEARDNDGQTPIDAQTAGLNHGIVKAIRHAIVERDRKALTASLESTHNLPASQRSQSSRQRP